MFSVYVGDSPKLGEISIVAVNAFSSWGEPISFSAIAGTRYRISVDGLFGDQGEMSFNVKLVPGNDVYAFATPIYGEQYATYASTRDASRESDEPSHGDLTEGRSVWWTWAAPASGLVTLECDSLDLQPVLAVYTGRGLTNLVLVAQSRGDEEEGMSGYLEFNAVAGVTYSIAVDGVNESGSSFLFTLTMALLRISAPLSGQIFAHPATIQVSVAVPPSMTGVEEVQFYDNEQLIAVATNAPFGFLWEQVTPGSHPLTARCVDGGGVTNSSLPVVALIYTNNVVPSPKLATWTTTSYVIDALGNLYVWGINQRGFYGLSGSMQDFSGCMDPFECEQPEMVKIWYPQIARFPEGVTGWLSVSGSAWIELAGQSWSSTGGWALGNNHRLYRYGVTPFEPASGATSWNLLDNSLMMDELGRIYYEGLLRDPQSSIPFANLIDGMMMTSNRVAYVLNGTNYEVLPFPEGVTAWNDLSCGAHCLGIGNDGQLYSWGYNYSGQLGLGDELNRTAPTKISLPAGATNWVAADVGGNHSLAIASNGRLYAWGRNWEYQLGIGYAESQTVNLPVEVPFPLGVKRWLKVAAGFAHSLAIGDDCQLYSWGGNGDGELGTGPGPSSPYPTRVPGVGPLCGIPLIASSQTRRLADGSFQIEIQSDLNRTYQIQYSSDAANWKTAFPSIIGTGDVIQWIDNGLPKTDSPPAEHPTRFYRVVTAL